MLIVALKLAILAVVTLATIIVLSVITIKSSQNALSDFLFGKK